MPAILTVWSFRLSSIVRGELEFAAETTTCGVRNLAPLTAIARHFTHVGVDANAARDDGRIRTFLEGNGSLIGANDIWIASQALAIGATMVTDGRREFGRVPGLGVETWITAADN